MGRVVDFASCCGANRDVNEDGVVVDDDLGLYAVFDFYRGLRPPTDEDARWRDEARRLLREGLRARGASDARGGVELAGACEELQLGFSALAAGAAALSITALLWPPFETRAWLSQLGNTVAFRVGAGGVRRLSSPHTVGRDAIAAGRLSIDDAARLPMRAVVTRAVGDAASRADVVEFVPGDDRVVIVSDGVHQDLDDGPVPIDVLQRLALGDAPAHALVDDVRRRLGRDNATALVVFDDQRAAQLASSGTKKA